MNSAVFPENRGISGNTAVAMQPRYSRNSAVFQEHKLKKVKGDVRNSAEFRKYRGRHATAVFPELRGISGTETTKTVKGKGDVWKSAEFQKSRGSFATTVFPELRGISGTPSQTIGKG